VHFCLVERKHLVNHWLDALGSRSPPIFGELSAIGTHEKKRVGDVPLSRETHDLAAQSGPNTNDRKKFSRRARSERGVQWPDERDDRAPGLRMPMDFSIASPPDGAKHRVVAAQHFLERLLLVVDHLVAPRRRNQVKVARAGGRSHLAPRCFANWIANRANAAHPAGMNAF